MGNCQTPKLKTALICHVQHKQKRMTQRGLLGIKITAIKFSSKEHIIFLSDFQSRQIDKTNTLHTKLGLRVLVALRH